jgi:hypothetical protein
VVLEPTFGKLEAVGLVPVPGFASDDYPTPPDQRFNWLPTN